ncbi:MAG TPA: hypothetical protein VF753_16405 [Terriglobales bacterium]
MKTLFKFVSTLAMLAVALTFVPAVALAQHQSASTPINLVAGVGGPVSTSTEWSNYSALNLVAGALLFPATGSSTTTRFYIGFTQGTEADISNMVMYTTKRGGTKITAVTPVTLNGVSNPSIKLSSTTVCKPAPSVSTPCVVPLDTLNVTLSTLNDYYFVMYFTEDTNNETVGAANAQYPITSLTGWYSSGDQTQLKVGKTIPSGYSGQHPYFLLYVMSH